MKKIISLFTLVFVMICMDVTVAYCNKIIVTIVIARHRDCIGFGLCEVTVKVPPKDLLQNVARASIDISGDGKLVVTINRSILNDDTYETYFSGDTFLCEDDFPVPDEILKYFDGIDSYTIRAGRYPIVKDGDDLVIEF